MDRLRRHPGLAHFNREQLALLERCTSKRQVERGAPVTQHGEATATAYFIQAGTVEVRRATPYGEFVLSRLATGDLIGEMALIDGAPRTGDVIAVSDLELRVLDAAGVAEAIRLDPSFETALHWTLWRGLSKKLRASNLRMVRFFHRHATAPPEIDLEAPRPSTLPLDERQLVLSELQLSSMEVRYLASLAEGLRLGPNQLVMRDGDPGRHMYIVVEGRIMISKHIPGAGEEALAFLGRGELFGEMALIDDTTRCADAKADEEGAVVLSLRKEVLDRLLDRRKASSIRVLRVLARHLARRLRDGNEKLVGWFILSGGDLGQEAEP